MGSGTKGLALLGLAWPGAQPKPGPRSREHRIPSLNDAGPQARLAAAGARPTCPSFRNRLGEPDPKLPIYACSWRVLKMSRRWRGMRDCSPVVSTGHAFRHWGRNRGGDLSARFPTLVSENGVVRLEVVAFGRLNLDAVADIRLDGSDGRSETFAIVVSRVGGRCRRMREFPWATAPQSAVKQVYDEARRRVRRCTVEWVSPLDPEPTEG
ncbi:hypothetical protein BKA81DRAFT_377513 [Phyllosticta paracitricarpa]|uniref:Uncharacterized protein n=1 Tax=Phyllosticta citricarpa TaxID=55181 RepID=A0ABR1MHP2_9PEZI